MSRKGNCWDNAVAESFFASLKKERIYKNRDLCVGLVMAVAPFTPSSYVCGVLVYALVMGWCYSAYAAAALSVIGRVLANAKPCGRSALA